MLLCISIQQPNPPLYESYTCRHAVRPVCKRMMPIYSLQEKMVEIACRSNNNARRIPEELQLCNFL